MNPATLQTFFTVILWGGILLTAVGTIGSQHFGKKVDKEKEQLAGANQKKLISQNQELLVNIEKYQQDLKEKDEKIEELDKKAKMAGRGITSIYDFDGTKRETTAGSIKASVGPEREVFKKMVQLEKSKEYPKLIKVCGQQIEKTPDWLTPYLYRGIAYANMGSKDEAVTDLSHVVKNAPGDPAYAQAEELLRKVEQLP